MENSTPPPPTEDTETVTFLPLACDDTSDTFILFIILLPPLLPQHASSPPASSPLTSFALLFSLTLPLVAPSREDSGPAIDLHCDSPRRVRPAVNLPISQERADEKSITFFLCRLFVRRRLALSRSPPPALTGPTVNVEHLPAAPF